MKKKQRLPAPPPPTRIERRLTAMQKRIAEQRMRDHDGLPPLRRAAATVIQSDPGNDHYARLALRCDDGRYLLSGRDLARLLGI